MQPTARFSSVAGCRVGLLAVPSVRPGDAIENVDPRWRLFLVWQTVFKFPFDS
jgi:hypothetical protein